MLDQTTQYKNFLFEKIYSTPSSKVVRRFGRIIKLHPIWWLIGIDQWIFPIAVYVTAFALLVSHRIKLKDFAFTFVISIYIFWHFVAVFGALDSDRVSHYLPLYFYRTIIFVSAPILCLILNSIIENSEDVLYLLTSLVIALVWSVIFSIIWYMLWQLGVQYTPTLLGLITPASMQNKVNIVSMAFSKAMIRSTYFFSITIPRTRGLFMYANLLAFIAEMSVPIAFYISWRTKKFKYVIFAFLIMGLIFGTISRTAVLVLCGGFMIIAFMLWKKTRILILLGSFLTLILLLLDLGGVMTSFSPTQTFTEASSSINEIREDSTRGRMMIYEATWEFIKEKPFMGWGTYQMFPGHSHWAYLGSHSTYLSTLIRFGFGGMIIFALIMLLTLKRYAKAFRPEYGLKSPLAAIGFACMIMGIVHMFVLDFHDDIFALHLFWMIVAMGSILVRLQKSENGVYL